MEDENEQDLHNNLAANYIKKGKVREAFPILKNMVKNERHLEDTHKIDSKRQLAKVYIYIGNQKQARELAEEACNASKQMIGSTHPLTLSCKSTVEAVVSN